MQNSLKIKNKHLNLYIKAHNFLYISEYLKINNNQEIFQNIRDSKTIIINQSIDHNNTPIDQFFYYMLQTNNINY